MALRSWWLLGLVPLLALPGAGCTFDASLSNYQPGDAGGLLEMGDAALPGDRGNEVGIDGPGGGDGDGPGGGDLELDTLQPCLGTTLSCGDPGACLDCTADPAGNACLLGACGCQTAADCPRGMACDPVSRACGTGCAGGLTCNGGCCDGAQCLSAAGQGPGSCGDNGGACVSCAGGSLGAACVPTPSGTGGACGCTVTSDCPALSTCSGGQCNTACSKTAMCAQSCCQGGVCQAGTAPDACGAAGSCVDCTADARGHACLPDVLTCGCLSEADCGPQQTCNLDTQQCESACGGASHTPCNDGCCDGISCQAGTAPAACGAVGGTCIDCSAARDGHLCIAATRSCGCGQAGDCNAQLACNIQTGVCESDCGDSSHTDCNGGCCNGGSCAAGTGDTACGQGGMCRNCTGDIDGERCIAGGNCGCSDEQDCPSPHNACGPEGFCGIFCGAGASPCNNGCCTSLGFCVDGTNRLACGNDGGSCSLCGGSKPACVSGDHCGCAQAQDCPRDQACNLDNETCGTSCGNGNRTDCNGGCCNNSNNCTTGTQHDECGNDGTDCVNCGTQSCQQSGQGGRCT